MVSENIFVRKFPIDSEGNFVRLNGLQFVFIKCFDPVVIIHGIEHQIIFLAGIENTSNSVVRKVSFGIEGDIKKLAGSDWQNHDFGMEIFRGSLSEILNFYF